MPGFENNLYTNNETSRFANPVLFPSSSYYPKTLNEAFSLCEYLYYLLPKFRQTQKRTARYFITDIEYKDVASETKEKLDTILKDILDIFTSMIALGDHWGCYGNAFARLHIPYIRYFYTKSKPTARYTYNTFSQFEKDGRIKFNSKDLTYIMPNPDSNFRSDAEFQFEDEINNDYLKLKLIIENPRNIRMIYNPISDSCRYVYKFPTDVINNISNGNIFVINTTPKSMLQAIAASKDFLFNEGEIFHFRSPIINGISKNNWGLSEIIANFRQIWQLMLYMRADEAVAMDYILPLRLFSMPRGQNGPADAMQMLDSLTFKSQMETLVKNKRMHPTAIQIAPFQVEYQEYGGTGKQYVPKDIIEYQENNLLSGSGFYTDFFGGTANIQIVPTALRMMENTYWFLYNNYNRYLKWVTKKVQLFLSEKPVDVQLQMPKYADNLETNNIKMNLGVQGLVPYKTMFESLGINDPVNAILERRKEDMQIETETMKLKDEQDRKLQAQQILLAESESQGDTTSTFPGSYGGTSILDKKQQAAEMAQQLLSTPVGPRRQQLEALKARDPVMYDFVMGNMRDARNEMRSQGTQIMKEQNGFI